MESMTGQRYGNLVVLDLLYYDKKHYYYNTVCDCGNNHVTTRNNLIRYMTTKCTLCSNKQRAESQVVNGANREPYTYGSYRSMLLRCATDLNYKDVEICDSWKGKLGFVEFLKDMGIRPQNTTLDRIDNSKGYFKENCRWSNSSVQNHNKSKRSDAETSKYIGVSFIANKNNFQCAIRANGERLQFFTNTEEEAAVLYDNMSEVIYGDRPNKTDYSEVIPETKFKGSVSYDKKSGKYRLRVHDLAEKRKTIGWFEDREEAEELRFEFNKFRFYRLLDIFKSKNTQIASAA